jgi:endonuclease YncB( thermonuclease family)
MKVAAQSLALLVLIGTTAVANAKPPPKAAAEPPAAECAAAGPLPAAWSGQAYAIDANTLGGVGLKPHIRLWGIQAPELRGAAKEETVAGMRARATLEDLLSKSDHKLKCRIAKFDGECRVVAQCSLDAGADSIDVAGAMIASGMAYGFDLDEALSWEPKASQRYADAEFEARKAKRGLWPVWLGDR